jgi:hypothetical protein
MVRLHGFCQYGNTCKVTLLPQVLKQPWRAEFVERIAVRW